MGKLTTGRLFEQLQTGVYSGCLAIVDDQPTDDHIDRLVNAAKQHYKIVKLLNLPSNDLQKSLENSELVIVTSLNNLDSQRAQAYTLRTQLDINRHRGANAIIYLTQAAFQCHFCDSRSPFYLFCHDIPISEISL
jgi:hypothetical protein